MKIGAFAKKFNVSIDTVRYYIKIGLLVPNRINKQYQMNQKCEDDMYFIMQLKNLLFSLEEIHKVLSIKRLINSTDNYDIAFFEDQLVSKEKELIKERDKMTIAIKLIQEMLHSNYPETKQSNFHSGVPVMFIPLLSCPMCNNTFQIENASMHGSHLFKGTLICIVCGYKSSIDEGILITEDVTASPYAYSPYEIDIEKWGLSFVSSLEKAKFWALSELRKYDLEKKVIIETNVEILMFLPEHLASLSKDAHYIFTSYSLEILKTLKNRIEKSNPDLNVLYIVNSDMVLPLKNKSIDFFIDSLSLNQFSLLYNESPMNIMKKYLSKDTKIIGTYIHYQPSAKSLKNIQTHYPNPDINAFYPNYLERRFSEINFFINEIKVFGSIANPGKYFIYHMKNEEIVHIVYTAAYQE